MDSNFINKLTKGSESAFEQLVKDYEKSVYSIAIRILNNSDLAYDASQDVFLKIYRSIGSFRKESKLSTWIYRITVNVCMDYIRKNERHKTISLNMYDNDDEHNELDIHDDGPTPEQSLENRETALVVKEAISLLSPEHKTVIILRDIKGFSYKEISRIISCNEGTVKSRINRAREKLKAILFDKRNFNAKKASKLSREGESSRELL